MSSRFDKNQADIIEAFSSIPWNLDDLCNIMFILNNGWSDFS